MTHTHTHTHTHINTHVVLYSTYMHTLYYTYMYYMYTHSFLKALFHRDVRAPGGVVRAHDQVQVQSHFEVGLFLIGLATPHLLIPALADAGITDDSATQVLLPTRVGPYKAD